MGALLYCKEPDCDEEFDSEQHYADHLAADHDQPDLLTRIEEHAEENRA